jgi:hypothetical protein
MPETGSWALGDEESPNFLSAFRYFVCVMRPRCREFEFAAEKPL